MIKPILKDKTLKKNLISLFAYIINNNEDAKIMTPQSILKTDDRDSVLLKIFIFLWHLWNRGASTHLNEIDHSYPKNKSCPLKMFNKDDEPKDYNLITESFYLFINSAHVCYYPLANKLTSLKKGLKVMETNINEILGKGESVIIQAAIMNLYKTKRAIETKIQSLDKLVNNDFVKNKLDEFYELLPKIILNYKEHVWDDMLTYLSQHISQKIKNIHDSEISNIETAQLFVRVIGTKLYTANPHIRSSFLSIAISCTVYEPEFNSNIVEAVINLFNDLELSKESGLELEKVSIRSMIHSYIMRKCFTTTDEKNLLLYKPTDRFYDIPKLLSKNEQKVKMFINFIVRDVSYIVGILYQKIDEFVTLDDDYLLQTVTNTINYIAKYLETLLQSLILITKYDETIKKIFTSKEVMISVRSGVSELIIKYYDLLEDANKNKRIAEIYSYTYTKLEIDKLVDNMLILIDSLDKDIVKGLFLNGIGINIDRFVNAIEKPEIKYDSKISFIQFLKSIKGSNDSEDEIEFPEDLIDSITYEPLEDPVFLPTTNTVMNRENIMQFIMTDQMHPYTKEPLTKKILDEYNNTDLIKDKKNIIMDKLKKFKEENGIP